MLRNHATFVTVDVEGGAGPLCRRSVKHKMIHLAKDSATSGHVKEQCVEVIRSRHEAKISSADNVVSTRILENIFWPEYRMISFKFYSATPYFLLALQAYNSGVT